MKIFQLQKVSILFEFKILLEKNIYKLAKIIGEDLKDDAIGEVREA